MADSPDVVRVMHSLHVIYSFDLQDGRTPLHWACTSGSLEIVRYLLDQKVEVDAKDSAGWTPLHIAGWPQTLGLCYSVS